MARRPAARVNDDVAVVEMEEEICEARRERLADLLDFVDRACARAALASDVAFDVRLATEEAVTNVIEHGYAGEETPGPISLRFRRDAQRVVVTIDDLAPPFDPATIRPADPSAPLEKRRIGGLGWHFVTRVMDEVRHELRHPRGEPLDDVRAHGVVEHRRRAHLHRPAPEQEVVEGVRELRDAPDAGEAPLGKRPGHGAGAGLQGDG